MKFATIALLIASVSAIQLQGPGTPQNQKDYWARENAIAAADAKVVAADAATAAATKQTKADKKAAVMAKMALTKEVYGVAKNVKEENSQNMHPETLKNQPPASMANEGMIEERDLKTSASNISDNTHTGEHWDGPKRGRIIRDYRAALDACNISGTGKCTQARIENEIKT